MSIKKITFVSILFAFFTQPLWCADDSSLLSGKKNKFSFDFSFSPPPPANTLSNLINGRSDAQGFCSENGRTSVLYRNKGVDNIRNVQKQILCGGGETAFSLDRSSFFDQKACLDEDMKKNFQKKCEEDKSLKRQYCQSCLEGNGLFAIPDKKRFNGFLLKAVDQAKDKLLEEIAIDYKNLSKSADKVLIHSHISDALDENFSCLQKNIEIFTETVLKLETSKCQRPMLDKIKKAFKEPAQKEGPQCDKTSCIAKQLESLISEGGGEHSHDYQKKLFSPNFHCEGKECQNLVKSFEFYPVVAEVLKRAKRGYGDHLSPKDARKVLDKFKKDYLDKLRNDLRKVKSDLDFNFEKEAKAQQLFLDYAEGRKQLSPEEISSSSKVAFERYLQIHLDRLSDRCELLIDNVSKLCQMDNHPENYKASDLLGIDFSNNSALVDQFGIKDENERKEVVDTLDRLSCYEQNFYKSSHLQSRLNKDHENYFNLKGEAVECHFEEGVGPVVIKMDTYNNEVFSMGEDYKKSYRIGSCSDGRPVKLKKKSIAKLKGRRKTYGYNVKGNLLKNISLVKRDKRFKKIFNKKSIQKILASVGPSSGDDRFGIRPSGRTSGGPSGNLSENLSRRGEAGKNPSRKEQRSSYLPNSISNLKGASESGLGAEAWSSLPPGQTQKIDDYVTNHPKVAGITRKIHGNNSKKEEMEKELARIESLKEGAPSAGEKLEHQSQLDDLQAQIEKLKQENKDLKNKRKMDVVSLKNKKLREEIAALKSSGKLSNDSADKSPRLGGAQELRKLPSTSSASVSSFSSPSSSPASSYSPSTSPSSRQGPNNQVGESTPFIADEEYSGLRQQGLKLSNQNLYSNNGTILAKKKDLLIIDNKTASLKDAAQLALKSNQNVFIFKGKAYIKEGETYILVQNKKARALRSEIVDLAGVEALLKSLDNDPYSEVLKDDLGVIEATIPLVDLFKKDETKNFKRSPANVETLWEIINKNR